jgi:hypothetical protein
MFQRMTGVNLNAAMEKYADNDVIILRDLYLSIDDLVSSQFDASVLDFHSANSLAQYGMLLHLPPEVKYNSGKRNLIMSRLFRLDPDQDTFVSAAMIGGKTMPRQTCFMSKHLQLDEHISSDDSGGVVLDMTNEDWHQHIDALVYLDISGMYVSLMKDHKYPYGQPKWAAPQDVDLVRDICNDPDPNRWTLLRDMFFIAEVDLELHPMEVEPPIAYKNHLGRTTWGIGRRVQKLTSIDLYLVLRNEGKVHSVNTMLIWDKSAPIFKRWMEKTLDMKERGEREGKEALRSFGKLCGNTTFGGLAMKTYENITSMCFTRSQLEDFYRQAHWQGVVNYKEGVIMWGKQKHDAEQINYSRSAKNLGVFVLAYSRLMVDDFIAALNPHRRSGSELGLLSQPYYGDTDSLLIHCSQLPRVSSLLGTKNGDWTCDLYKHFYADPNLPRFGLVLELIAPAPKSYAISYALPQQSNDGRWIVPLDQKKEKIRFKGIRSGMPLTYKNKLYPKLSLTLLKICYKDGCTEEDNLANEEEPTEPDLPTATVEGIQRLGYKLSYEQRARGVVPFTLSQKVLKRTLFRTAYSGKQVACSRDTSAAGMYNKVLVPNDFDLELI